MTDKKLGPRPRSLFYQNLETCRQTCRPDCPGRPGQDRLQADQAQVGPKAYFPDWERRLRYGDTYEQLIRLRALKDIKSIGGTIVADKSPAPASFRFESGPDRSISGRVETIILTDNPLRAPGANQPGIVNLSPISDRIKARPAETTAMIDPDLIYIGGPGIWLVRTDPWPITGNLRLIWAADFLDKSPVTSRPQEWPELSLWPNDRSSPNRQFGCWLLTIEADDRGPVLIRPNNSQRQAWERGFNTNYCRAIVDRPGDYIIDAWIAPE